MASELRLPAMREQLVDSAVQMGRWPRENVLQVRPWVMTMHLCRLHQTHDDGGALAGKFTASK